MLGSTAHRRIKQKNVYLFEGKKGDRPWIDLSARSESTMYFDYVIWTKDQDPAV